MLRLLRPDDQDLLTKATLGAFNWDDQGRYTLDELERTPYLSDWPQPFGLVAGADRGVAWWRFFTAADPGYGFVDESIPELCIWVAADHRGRGLGRRLLNGLIEQALSQGLPGLSLNVEDGNPARRLYERLGFVRAGDDPGTLVHFTGGTRSDPSISTIHRTT